VSRFSPEIVALVRRCLPKIRCAIPCSYQLVYEYPTSLVVACSVTIKAASDLDHADIQALFKAAIRRSGVSFPKTRPTRLVIKSTSTKQDRRDPPDFLLAAPR
jgi:hypothetical protein